MPSEALAAPADGGSEDDYKAFYAVLASSARGRAFLSEHARRARHAETETLLAALARIEAMVAEQRAQPAPPAPAPPQPAAATALAAVAAQAIAAAESDLPVMRVIKAGQMPPPARFAGDDFRADETLPDPMAAASEDDTAAPGEMVAATSDIDVGRAESPDEPAGLAVPSSLVAGDVPAGHAPPPGAPVADALAAILALSEEERLALFS